MGDDLFKTRTEAIDKGRDYEYLNIANIILNLTFNKNIRNYKIACNAQNYGLFDDIVLEAEYTTGKKTEYLLQLKHSNRSLSTESLKAGKLSIEKFFESYRADVKHKNSYLILFTNAEFDDKAASIETTSFNLTTTQEEANSLFNTNVSKLCTKFKIHSFNRSGRIEHKLEVEKFFNNFSLYANQINSTKMEELILQKFEQLFCSSKDTCLKFLNFINEWCKMSGTKPKLNKSWVQQAITIRLLSPYMVPIPAKKSNKTPSDKTVHFRNIINSFNVTIFDEKAKDDLAQIWQDSKANFDVGQLNKIKDKLFLNMPRFKSITALNDSEWSQWLIDTHPAIVTNNEITLKAIELCPNKKYILLKKNCSDLEPENVSIFQRLSDLKSNSRYESLVEKLTCYVQGKEVCLNDLLKRHPELVSRITSNELLQMIIHRPFAIGGNQEELPKPHIERKVSTIIINSKEFLRQLQKEDQKSIVVISCGGKQDKIDEYLKNFNVVIVEDFLENAVKANNDQKIFITNQKCSQNDFEKICNKNKAISQCHHFYVLDDGNFEWIKTKGNNEELEPFRLPSYSVDEFELYSSDPVNNINVICSNPGMGKSVSAKYLKNQLPTNYWIIIVHPSNVSAYFRENYNEAFEDYIENKVSKNYTKFDKVVMQCFRSKRQIAYIWDGLDEISDKDLNKTLDIIDSLTKKGFLQWITSRCHLQNKLENKFKVFAKTLLQFDDEQQERYIKQRLGSVSPDNVEDIIKKIKFNIDIIHCHEVLGIPLQIYMITELFCRNTEKYSALLKDIFLITDLYYHFVHEKFNRYYEEKTEVKKPNNSLQKILDAHKKSYIKKYEKAALTMLDEPNLFERLSVNCDEFLETIKKERDEFGFITEVSENMVPTFLHNSYGEFFIALYFFKNYMKITELKNILFKKRYTNVRFLFDMLMAKHSPVHIAVLYKNPKLLMNNEDKLGFKDQGGRTALHLACTWGQMYPLLDTTSCNEENDIIYEIKEELGKSIENEDMVYQEIIKYLIKKCDYKEKDNLFQMNAVSYADAALCLFPLIELSKHEKLATENLDNFKDFGTLLYYALKFDHDHMIDTIRNVPVVKTKKRGLTLLHVCAEFNSKKSLRKLLEIDQYRSIINNADIYDVLPVTIACKKGHAIILRTLIDEGADILSNIFQLIQDACKGGHHQIVEMLVQYKGINIKDDRGKISSSLKAACLSGYDKIVQLLIDFGAKVNVNTPKGTPLYMACHYGHEETVKILVQAGANVNQPNRFGFTPLHIACQKKHVTIAKFLIHSNADINAIDKKGLTSVHVVTKNQCEEILQLLLESKADVNKADIKKKVTPLHNACQIGNEKVVKMLINAGADVNCCCKEGCTPLHMAREYNHLAIIELLLKCNANDFSSNA